MIVVVASRHDREAAALAQRWPDTAVMTCEDLSVPGWYFSVDDPASSIAVVANRVVPVSAITGVLTRRPRIFDVELVRFPETEREFVAAEMTAFLLAWLTSLSCPVLGRPAPGCLCGPGWGQERWTWTAAAIGIPVKPRQRTVPVRTIDQASGPYVSVTIVDGSCVPANTDDAIAGFARQLATAAGVRLLSVRFEIEASSPVFVDAAPMPDRIDDPVADALLKALSR